MLEQTKVRLRQLSPKRGVMGAQLASFAAIGVTSTVAFMLLFVVLRPFVGAQLANIAALFICAMGNTAANRRLTFAITQVGNPLRTHAEGVMVFLVGLALTSGTLMALERVMPSAQSVWQLLGVTVANLVATASKFVLLRQWVFRPDRHGSNVAA